LILIEVLEVSNQAFSFHHLGSKTYSDWFEIDKTSGQITTQSQGHRCRH